MDLKKLHLKFRPRLHICWIGTVEVPLYSFSIDSLDYRKIITVTTKCHQHSDSNFKRPFIHQNLFILTKFIFLYKMLLLHFFDCLVH